MRRVIELGYLVRCVEVFVVGGSAPLSVVSVLEVSEKLEIMEKGSERSKVK